MRWATLPRGGLVQRLQLAGVAIVLALSWLGQTEAIGAEVDFRVQARPRPQFPKALRLEGYVEGKVVLTVAVSQDGELIDYLVTEATHELFARAVEKVVPGWKFDPPMVNGELAAVAETIRVDFQGDDIVTFSASDAVSTSFFGQRSRKGKNLVRTAQISELDAVPAPVFVSEPVFPSDAIAAGETRRAVFEFFIDRYGQVRLPMLREADSDLDERVLVSAQNALLGWRFEPPRVRGKPILAKVAQPFRFESPPAP